MCNTGHGGLAIAGVGPGATKEAESSALPPSPASKSLGHAEPMPVLTTDGKREQWSRPSRLSRTAAGAAQGAVGGGGNEFKWA